MTSMQLFKKRCFHNFRFQIRAWRMGIDWTVLLYLLVPAVIVAIAVYRSWWVELPKWMEMLPFEGFLFLFYVFSWMGSVRLFIEEADELFLLQNRAFYQSLRRWGMLYSGVKQIALTGLFFTVFLPYFMTFHFLNVQLLQLFVVLAMWKTVLLFIKDVCYYLVIKRWVRIGVFICLFIAGYFIFSFFTSRFYLHPIFIIFLFIVSFMLFRWKTNTIVHFYSEVVREYDAKFQIVKLMLTSSGAIEKPKTKRRKKPWIFRRSQRLFSRRELDTVMLEQYIKIWLRKPQQLFSYFRFIGVSTVALFLFPTTWGIVLVLMILFLFYQIVRSEWESFAKSHFIEMMTRDVETLYFVKTKVICLFCLPMYVFILVIYGLTTSNWLLAFIVFIIVACILFIPWIRFKLERS